MKRRAFVGSVARDGSNYLDRIRTGLEFIRFGEGLPSRPRIFIKPNLTFPSFRAGVMTSPAALESAIVAVKDYTDEVWVGDSDSGGYNPFAMEEVYKATGINEFADRHGVQVVNLSKLERVEVTIRARGKELSVHLPRLLVEDTDMLVTMPVPKVHMNTGVSLTFKNQWGCIPEPTDRLRLHPYFNEVVVAVNAAVKAGVALIDGRFGLNRSGPMKGDDVFLGWLAATSDIGTGARVACELMRLRPESFGHLHHAQSLGLIPRLDEIEVSAPLPPFLGPKFYLERIWTDYPGLLAFKSLSVAKLAYFSRYAEPLHSLLYRFREPFYDYSRQ